MPAAKSNGVQRALSVTKEGGGIARDGRAVGEGSTPPPPRKRQRKSVEIVPHDKQVMGRKNIAKKQVPETDAATPAAAAADEEVQPKTPRRATGQKAKMRSSNGALENGSKSSIPSEAPEVSETPSKFSKRKTIANGRRSRAKVRPAKENGTKSRGSITPKAERPSARANGPKAADAVTPPDVGAADEEGGSARQRKKRPTRLEKNGGAKEDEKMRIKRRVKNLVNRIRLEQHLLDAYAGEGWKGGSREKVRPEKELQRADTQILRSKFAIRELIHDLDNLGLEGTLEQSAFDEEGRIFHEAIFCAKCKSQETFPDNDIILCDGSCDRGFHQECLDPPLSTKDIPPGDEGWLCPVCDSKVECLNYINSYLSTEFHVEDSWDRIFAEAAASAAGGTSNTLDDDWPSEDSEDDDYDPERRVTEEGTDEGEGGDGDGTKGGLMSLSSDTESESEASSGSDLGSDDDSQVSDMGADDILKDGERRSGVRGRVSNHGIVDLEIGNPPDSLPAEDDVPVSGKRRRKLVDYKKLHDEMFGKEEADDDVVSEDEEWGPGKKRRRGRPDAVNGVVKGPAPGKEQKLVHRQSVTGERSDDEPGQGRRNSSSDNQSAKAKSRRLPDGSVEVLRREFEAESHPPGAHKKVLAQRLGISFKQVCSWFKNARRSAKHGIGQKSPLQTPRKRAEAGASPHGDWKFRVGGVDELEMTNGLLVEKLDEVQLKLHYLKQALEAIEAKPDAGSERVGDGGGIFDTGIVMSYKNGKRILYVPVAEVVEKDA